MLCACRGLPARTRQGWGSGSCPPKLRAGGGYELHTLQIFTVTAEGISRNSLFQDSEVFAPFGLAAALDAQGLAAGKDNANGPARCQSPCDSGRQLAGAVEHAWRPPDVFRWTIVEYGRVSLCVALQFPPGAGA
jgi:hypothetical protein